MLNKRRIVSISLSSKTLYFLDQICQQEDKNRSEVVKELIRQYGLKQKWDTIFERGKETASKFDIHCEADILKLIND